ncbi:MAG TPA: methyltransferase domain-containing protein [Candidatus Acidoferrales bacterium]|nr:methyltransferase domain-containing protein [Candidatus Acidoferrales bacterium]
MISPNDRRQKDLIREQFTRTAQAFGDYAIAHRVREAEWLARAVRASPSDCVVDLACEPGSLALRFARHVRWVCGLDLTPAMLERARLSVNAERLANIDFLVGDAQALPFADSTLDIAVTSYSFHHLPDPALALREMARVVKGSGRVGVIDIRASEDARTAELNNRIERIRDDSHTRTLARSEFEGIFAANGLRVLSIETVEDLREFDHWMYVAGHARGDHEYDETRRMVEATIPDDSAGFHPQFISGGAKGGDSGGGCSLHIVNTMILIAAEKERA